MEIPGLTKMGRKIFYVWISLVAQWIRLHAPSAGGLGLIPGQGTRSHMHATNKSLHAVTKEPASCNKGARVLQLRPGTTK